MDRLLKHEGFENSTYREYRPFVYKAIHRRGPHFTASVSRSAYGTQDVPGSLKKFRISGLYVTLIISHLLVGFKLKPIC